MVDFAAYYSVVRVNISKYLDISDHVFFLPSYDQVEGVSMSMSRALNILY